MKTQIGYRKTWRQQKDSIRSVWLWMRYEEQKVIMNKLLEQKEEKKVRTEIHLLEKEEIAWRTDKKKPYRLTPYE